MTHQGRGAHAGSVGQPGIFRTWTAAARWGYCGAGVLDASPFRTPLRVAQHWPRPGIGSTRAPATFSAEGLTHGHERPGRAQGRSNHVG